MSKNVTRSPESELALHASSFIFNGPPKLRQLAFEKICWYHDCCLEALLEIDDVTREMAIDWINRYDNELKLVWRQAKRAKAA